MLARLAAAESAIALANSIRLAATRWDKISGNLACYLTEAYGQFCELAARSDWLARSGIATVAYQSAAADGTDPD